MDQDVEHLRLLSIFHYVVGGMAALFACIPVVHLLFGIAIASGVIKPAPGQEPPPAFIGYFVIVIASAFILLGWSFAIAILVAGRFLARRTHYTYCLVVAGIESLFMPFGTVLSVFTIAALIQPSAKSLFQGRCPDIEAHARSSPNAARVLWALLFAMVGCLVGVLSFAQLGSCIGYYIGMFINGFGRQPPLGYVLAGAGLFILPGCVCGALAGLRLRQGLRPNLAIVIMIALANTAALLGTIDIAFDVSFESLTMRTALVGIVSGIMVGLIVSLLLRKNLSQATNTGSPALACGGGPMDG